jgi:hypothetical protein
LLASGSLSPKSKSGKSSPPVTPGALPAVLGLLRGKDNVVSLLLLLLLLSSGSVLLRRRLLFLDSKKVLQPDRIDEDCPKEERLVIPTNSERKNAGNAKYNKHQDGKEELQSIMVCYQILLE